MQSRGTCHLTNDRHASLKSRRANATTPDFPRPMIRSHHLPSPLRSPHRQILPPRYVRSVPPWTVCGFQMDSCISFRATSQAAKQFGNANQLNMIGRTVNASQLLRRFLALNVIPDCDEQVIETRVGSQSNGIARIARYIDDQFTDDG